MTLGSCHEIVGASQKKLRPLLLLSNGPLNLLITPFFSVLTMGFDCYRNEKGVNQEGSKVDVSL